MTPAQRQIALRKMALHSIPDDWEMVTVGSIAQKKSNSIVGGPFGSDLVSTDYVPAGVPVIRGQNMGQAYVSGDFAFVSEEKAKALSSNLAAPGDVIFTQRGTLGQVSVAPDSPFDRYLISQSQMKVSVDPQRFNVAFLCQYFCSVAGQQQILESAIQTGVPHTNLSILRGYYLPRPLIHEQQAIAAALSDADGVVAGLERVIAKKRLIKQGAMQDLLTARRRLPGFSGEWEVKRLGSLGICLRGVSYDGSADLFETETRESIMLLRANNVQIGEIVYSDVQHVRKERVKPVQHLKRGDVLVCMANGSRTLVGKAGVFWEDGGATFTFGAFMGCFRPAPGAAADGFIPFLFQSDEYRNQLNVILSGSAINNLAPSQILGFSFKMPVDHSEQQAIAAVLSDMDAEIQTLDTRLAKARAVKEGMMQNLLTGRVRLV